MKKIIGFSISILYTNTNARYISYEITVLRCNRNVKFKSYFSMPAKG
jgi:hypothetical protein